MEETAPVFSVRPLVVSDRNWVAHFLDSHWGSTKIVTRGKAYYAHLLPGFVAEWIDRPEDSAPIGLVIYRAEGTECEIMTIDSTYTGIGVGSALIEAVKAAAAAEGCKRLWLITTNDNLQALKFFQKRGLRLVAVYPDALAESRKLKPQIPLIGKEGIPLRDEIELDLAL
jgi:DNA-3-methyladenine glycosylase I